MPVDWLPGWTDFMQPEVGPWRWGQGGALSIQLVSWAGREGERE